MELKSTVIRPIRKTDVVEMMGRTYPHSIRGFAAERDGVLTGIAGIMYTQPLQCFSTLTDDIKGDKRAIVKAARLMRELLNKCNGDVYAIASHTEPTAPGFLRHIGFDETAEGVYRWTQNK